MKSRHYILVVIQFAGIFLMIFTGKNFPDNVLTGILELSSVLLVLWAYFSMQRHTFSVMPNVRKNAQLCTSGPYKYIRHPMYTAVLLLLSGLLVNSFSYFRLIILFVVFIDFLFKINVEEKMLSAKFEDYKRYSIRTKRLIPFIY